MIDINYEEWTEKFSPLQEEEGSVKLYETYDKDFEEVWNTDRRYVWTLVEGEDGNWYLEPGILYVNRMNYVICRNPRNLEDNYEPIKYF